MTEFWAKFWLLVFGAFLFGISQISQITVVVLFPNGGWGRVIFSMGLILLGLVLAGVFVVHNWND